MGGSRMAANPARINKMLRAMDQPVDLKELEEGAMEALFMENPPEIALHGPMSARRIPQETSFLDNEFCAGFLG
jgi:hypothetical protein